MAKSKRNSSYISRTLPLFIFVAALVFLKSDPVQYKWASIRMEGYGPIPQNQPRAINIFHKTAEKGHVKSQYRLGEIYLEGNGVQADRNIARKWLNHAAEQGHPEAIAKLEQLEKENSSIIDAVAGWFDKKQESTGEWWGKHGDTVKKTGIGVATVAITTYFAHKYFNRSGESEPLHRPYLRQSTKEEIYRNAPRTADGYFIDPNTGQKITGDFHIGHKPGHENWRILEMAEKKLWTQDQVGDYVNSHPELFQIEDPSSNMSHVFEQKD